MKRIGFPWSRLALALVVLLAVLPPVAVLLYAFSTRWDRSLLPEDATWAWLAAVVRTPRVQAAVVQTLALSLASATLTLLVGGSATIVARLVSARATALLDALSLLPYAIPPVVIAIGALELFVGRWGAWLDLRVVYVVVAAPLLFPLLHKTLSAAMRQLDVAPLMEAAHTLGATDGFLLRRVLLPLLAPALVACLLLCWVTAAMEFAIANLLLGGSIEMLQPLMNGMRGVNGHLSAALVVLSFAVITAMGMTVEGLMAWNTRRNS
jgi:ABC-type spermidine/putrescine transport system permease subunit II